MASIRKRGSKWQVQVRSNGHPSVNKTFHHKADAAVWARHIEAEIDRTALPANPRALRRLTIRQIAIRYRDEVVSKKRGGQNETIVLNAFARHRISEVTLAEATPAMFGTYRDERLRSVKAGTVRRELGLLQHMFKVARQEWGIPIATNPVKDISKPVPDKPRNRRLEADEFDRLIKASSECRNSLIEPIIRFAIETGMRRGEILRTSWSNIDWEARTLHIPETKNGHPRTIPLSKAAVRLLERHPRGQGDLVFPTSASSLQQAWKRLTKRAGIGDLHFHDPRHEAISRFFEKGAGRPGSGPDQRPSRLPPALPLHPSPS